MYIFLLMCIFLSILPFAIVDFENGGGLAVIPTKWFIGPEEDECYWPPARVNIAKAVIDQQDPHSDWATFKLTVKRKAATYEIARIKLVEFEQNTYDPTESDSAENMGRGKRKNRSALTPPLPPSSLRSVLTPPLPPSTHTPTPSLPPFTHRSVLTPPLPSSTNTPTPPLPPFTHRSVLMPPLPSSTQRPTPPLLPATQSSTLTPPLPPAPLRSAMSTHESLQMQIRDNVLFHILKVLEEVKETLRVHGRMLQTMAQRGNSGDTLSIIPDGFPLKTVGEVEVMEEKLSDPSFMSELVTAVADIGGSTVDDATRCMMVFIMDHDLSRQYNFVGRNGKREFRTLKLFEVIFVPAGALKKNALTSQITRKDVERAVSKWLIGSRDRGGNRQARQVPQVPPSPSFSH
ncbi:uncharacterized protein LOC119789318 [Cyprinodon tularosa]|uniref:uncharacterized protein LOC119789318 n=1 Tax=Cyprinodon tularosa TaxID=77115 RepID=UPI0018E26F4E|nr:uncharacterized protein LOC119789318 [Cyprinodon tularosa]